MKSESEVAQLCPTLSMDCSLPGSSVHGIFQARVLEWGAIAFSVGNAGPRQILLTVFWIDICQILWCWRERSVHLFCQLCYWLGRMLLDLILLTEGRTRWEFSTWQFSAGQDCRHIGQSTFSSVSGVPDGFSSSLRASGWWWDNMNALHSEDLGRLSYCWPPLEILLSDELSWDVLNIFFFFFVPQFTSSVFVDFCLLSQSTRSSPLYQ